MKPDQILLLPEQEALLARLVAIDRNLPRHHRESFFFHQSFSGAAWAQHPSIPGSRITLEKGDIEVLVRRGFILLAHAGGTISTFDVTPEGSDYYEQMMRRAGSPAHQVDAGIRRFLDAEDFQRRYPQATDRWNETVTRLWASDEQTEWIMIARLCREAMNAFAVEFASRFRPVSDEQAGQPAEAIATINDILEEQGARLDPADRALLEVLGAYWRVVTTLADQQAGDAGGSVTWESTRRIVFQTGVMMFELDWSFAGRRE